MAAVDVVGRKNRGGAGMLEPADWRLYRFWLVVLSSVYLLAGVTLAPRFASMRRASADRHQARMDPIASEPGLTPADLTEPAGAEPALVDVGIYVERIVEISIKDASWTVDFQVWFRWKDGELSPAEGFDVVDGTIDFVQTLDTHVADNDFYVRKRVIATITKPFDIARFPCDDHLLTINLENPKYRRHRMKFVADKSASGVSSRAKVSAYEIFRKDAIEKPHSYATALGDPRIEPGTKSTHSQFRFGIWIRRASWGFYFKMFQSLFIAVAIAMVALFVKPTHVDPRFGLAVGGLFAAVANTYITSSLIPDTGVMTLADIVNLIGIGSIFFTVVQSTLSLYLFDNQGKELLSRRLDMTSFCLFVVGYAVSNVILPMSATNWNR
jgi:hypothetical protein